MARILSFAPEMPSITCPRCDGRGIEATVFNPFTEQPQDVPCGKCAATGRLTALAHAEGEVRYWRSRWESVQQHPRARKERQTAAENLEFWTNKAAMYAAMQRRG